MSDEVPQSTPAEQQPAGDRPTSPQVSLDKAAAAAPATPRDPAPVPGPGSVHDRQTLNSLPADPGSTPADAVPPAWAPPTAGTASPAGPYASPAGPYAPPAHLAPPAATPPANSYGAQSAPANPFAAPSAPGYAYPPPAPASPYAPPAGQHPGPEPVPPPPIAPDGPGLVPYGYPGTPGAYGYPAASQSPYPGGHPARNGYGWPGMQPLPSNGMGTAALVCGILAAVGFLLWPVALVLGILSIIFGAIGRGKAKRGEATNPGMALAGLICGAVGIVLVLGLFAFVIAINT